jgi:hypothetical protein
LAIRAVIPVFLDESIMSSDSEVQSSGGSGIDVGLAGYGSLFEQLGRMRQESQLSRESGDPYDLMQQQRGLRDSEYSGATGFIRYYLHKDDADEAEQEYLSAQQANQNADLNKANTAKIADNQNKMFAALKQSDRAALLSQLAPGPTRDEIVAQYSYQDAIQQADVLNENTFSQYGGEFKNEGDFQKAIGRLKMNAGIVRDEAHNRAVNKRWFDESQDEGRLKSLQLRGSGDTIGAERQDLVSELDAEDYAVDPNDWDANARFARIRKQTISNFDADAARKQKLEAAQSEDRVLAYQEEGTEAKLRGEGKDWEASNAALKFSTEQRVRTLREQADAEADITKKQQLNREADAADQAGKLEAQAQQQEHLRGLGQKSSGQGQQFPSPANGDASGLTNWLKDRFGSPTAGGDSILPYRIGQTGHSETLEDHFKRNEPFLDQLLQGAKSGRQARSHEHGDEAHVQGDVSYISDPAALRQQYEMRNIQAAGLQSGAGLNTGQHAGANTPGFDFSKFFDVLSKLDRHFSRSVTLAMVRD